MIRFSSLTLIQNIPPLENLENTLYIFWTQTFKLFIWQLSSIYINGRGKKDLSLNENILKHIISTSLYG